MPASTHRQTRRKSPRKNKDSLVGNLLLELVAMIALLFVVAISNNIDRAGDDGQLTYQSTGVGTAVGDFLKDQVEYQKRWRQE